MAQIKNPRSRGFSIRARYRFTSTTLFHWHRLKIRASKQLRHESGHGQVSLFFENLGADYKSAPTEFYVFNPFFVKQKKLEGTWNSFSEQLEAFNSNRLGLIYYPFKTQNTLNNVKNQLILEAFIKANLAQADLFEYSIGYVF